MPQPSSASPIRLPAHIPTLNGLRAFACLAVFGVHWQQFTRFSATWGPFDARQFLEHGNTGVSLLFTLSGFLISLRFWAGIWGQGRPWVRQYVRSRLLRILPPYYLCLAALVAASGHVMAAWDQRDVLLHVAFLHNMREGSFYAYNPSFWTLAVQAQAYVLMPVVVVLVLRASSWAGRASWLIAIIAASYGAHWATLTLAPSHGAIADWAASRPTVATHSLLAHAPHFLLGLLAGLIYVRRISRPDTPVGGGPSIAREIAVVTVGAAILLILSTPLDQWFSVPYGRYNFPFVPIAIAWLILETPRTRVVRALLDAPPLHWLGVISFGVYVYHHPCQRVIGALMARNGLSIADHWAVFGATSFALTVIVASLSFAAIESPILYLAKRRQQRHQALALSAS